MRIEILSRTYLINEIAVTWEGEAPAEPKEVAEGLHIRSCYLFSGGRIKDGLYIAFELILRSGFYLPVLNRVAFGFNFSARREPRPPTSHHL